MDNHQLKILLLFGFIGLFTTVCSGVRIRNLRVPSEYTIEQDDDDLILDCEYDVMDNETGFTLKWLFNDLLIYQWIPTAKTPHVFSIFRGNVDIAYSASDSKYHKHRAVYITNPTWDMSGTYECQVQTYESVDKRSAHLQMIVPESDFQLTRTVDEYGLVNITCSVNDVYPSPNISIVLNNDEHLATNVILYETDSDGLYNLTEESVLRKEQLESPTTINCILNLPGTNYTKRREAIYYDTESTLDSLQSAIDTDDDSDEGEESSSSSRLEADSDGDSGHHISASISFTILLLGAYLVFLQ